LATLGTSPPGGGSATDAARFAADTTTSDEHTNTAPRNAATGRRERAARGRTTDADIGALWQPTIAEIFDNR
jgi:hypothetical protein